MVLRNDFCSLYGVKSMDGWMNVSMCVLCCLYIFIACVLGQRRKQGERAAASKTMLFYSALFCFCSFVFPLL